MSMHALLVVFGHGGRMHACMHDLTTCSSLAMADDDLLQNNLIYIVRLHGALHLRMGTALTLRPGTLCYILC